MVSIVFENLVLDIMRLSFYLLLSEKILFSFEIFIIQNIILELLLVLVLVLLVLFNSKT